MTGENPKVDFYFAKADRWQDTIMHLRKLALGCGLTEELKWGCPCYLWEGSNIVLIHTFKEYCALLFFKGSLLADPDGILIQQTENVQASRQIRFTEARQPVQQAAAIRACIFQAIEVEKAGLKVALKKTRDFTMVEEFSKKLEEVPGLKKAFESLTPGRQRGYLLHFSSAKQAKTREARVEKCIPHILDGRGLDDV